MLRFFFTFHMDESSVKEYNIDKSIIDKANIL